MDFPRDFPHNGSHDIQSISIPSSKSWFNKNNEVHVYDLHYQIRVALCAAVNPRVNLKLLVMFGQKFVMVGQEAGMVGQEAGMVGQMPIHAHPWLRPCCLSNILHNFVLIESIITLFMEPTTFSLIGLNI